MKPISPREALERGSFIPPEVIATFNEMIIENMSGNSAHVGQPAVVKRAAENMGIASKDFDYRWLNVEETFRAAGWKVSYDKPAYCESYDAYFIFEAS